MNKRKKPLDVPEVITAEWLGEKGACPSLVGLFQAVFPNGAPWTVNNIAHATAWMLWPDWPFRNALGYVHLDVPTTLRDDFQFFAESGEAAIAYASAYGLLEE